MWNWVNFHQNSVNSIHFDSHRCIWWPWWDYSDAFTLAWLMLWAPRLHSTSNVGARETEIAPDAELLQLVSTCDQRSSHPNTQHHSPSFRSRTAGLGRSERRIYDECRSRRWNMLGRCSGGGGSLCSWTLLDIQAGAEYQMLIFRAVEFYNFTT